MKTCFLVSVVLALCLTAGAPTFGANDTGGSGTNDQNINGYSDKSPTSPPYLDPISVLTDSGVLAGYTDGTFGPGESLTREQADKIITIINHGVAAANSVPVPAGLSEAGPAVPNTRLVDPKNGVAAQSLSDAMELRVLELLLAGPAVPNTRLVDPNLGQTALLDERIKTLTGNAVIAGTLDAGGSYSGTYGFNVNLFSGAISGGTMSGGGGGTSYNLSGGIGSVSGNNFNLSGFQGTVDGSAGSGSMSGTAGKGFGKLGDIGASGEAYIWQNSGGTWGPISISSGRRVK